MRGGGWVTNMTILLTHILLIFAVVLSVVYHSSATTDCNVEKWDLSRDGKINVLDIIDLVKVTLAESCADYENADCVGYWSECTELCEDAGARTFTVVRPQSGSGEACPATTDDCVDGDGQCKDVDCVISVPPCTHACEKDYERRPFAIIAVEQRGAGAHCSMDGAGLLDLPDCQCGDGQCKVCSKVIFDDIYMNMASPISPFENWFHVYDFSFTTLGYFHKWKQLTIQKLTQDWPDFSGLPVKTEFAPAQTYSWQQITTILFGNQLYTFRETTLQTSNGKKAKYWGYLAPTPTKPMFLFDGCRILGNCGA